MHLSLICILIEKKANRKVRTSVVFPDLNNIFYVSLLNLDLLTFGLNFNMEIGRLSSHTLLWVFIVIFLLPPFRF